MNRPVKMVVFPLVLARARELSMKKALPILVIASMMFSLIPSAFALPAPVLDFTIGNKGTTIKVTGPAGTVPAGTIVQLYWDTTTGDWNGVKGLLNMTTARASGAYEVWFNVPEATNGLHYVWVKDVGDNIASAGFTVTTKIKNTPTSGLPGDTITGNFYGFSGSKDIALVLSTVTPPAPTGVPNELLATPGGSQTEFTGTIANKYIVPGTVLFRTNGVEQAHDDGAGNIVDSIGPLTASGTINYVTGAYDIIFTTPPPVLPIGLRTDYSYWGTSATQFDLGKGTTNSVGSATLSWSVPIGVTNPATYYFTAMDAKGVIASTTFDVGHMMALSSTSGAVGDIIHITGRGWTPFTTILEPVLSRSGYTANCYIVTTPVTVDGTGRFSLDMVVSGAPMVKDDYIITVSDSAHVFSATAYFEVTALQTLTVDPLFAEVGAAIHVSGTHWRNIASTVVTIDLTKTDGTFVYNIGTCNTLSDGSFSKLFVVGVVVEGDYKIRASIGGYTTESTFFRVGMMNIALSKSSGQVGDTITIAGNGFTKSGTWKATIGTKTLVASELVDSNGLILKSVVIPIGLAAGVYTISVMDINAGITLTAQFEVIAGATTTWYTVPEKAPINTQVTIKGYHFTPSKTWTAKINGGTITGSTNSNGEILGTFMAPNTVAKYTLEVTDDFTLSSSSFDLEVINPVAPQTQPTMYAGPTDASPDIELTLENLTPYPVQSALYPDIKADNTVDLVIGKDTTIVVDVSGVVGVNWPLTINFNGKSITLDSTKKNTNGMLIFTGFPTLLGQQEGARQIILSDGIGVLKPVPVNAYLTNDLYTAYVPLARPNDYGSISPENIQLMVDSSNKLLESTYPVAKSNIYLAPTLTGIDNSLADNWKKDAVNVKGIAVGNAGAHSWSIGVALAPDNYFTYHRFSSETAGITINPNCKGVIVLDGYYSGAAHEIAHTLGLCWPDEEYLIPQVVARGDLGYRSTGVSVSDNYVVDSWNIMGYGDYRKPYHNWVTTETYEDLFKQLRSTTVDPELVLVSGDIHRDGTVTYYDLPWYRFDGTADTIIPGSYSLKFMSGTGVKLETSFGAWFGICIEPKANVAPGTPGYGYVETDSATFCFTTVLPAGTTEIRLMDNTDPNNKKTLAVIPASELVVYPRANAGGPYESFTNVATTFDASGSTGKDLTYRWDFNGDGVFDTGWLNTPKTTHTYTTAWSGIAVLEVTDGHLTQRSEAQVTIHQQPTIQSITAPLVPQSVGNVVTVNTVFVNYVQGIVHVLYLQGSGYTANIDWGDGQITPGIVALEDNLIKISGTHKYASAGIYTVTISLLYNDITSATATSQYIIIYNPSKGSVTGAGYYNSPVGAYKSDMKLTGKAAFLILAKYSKGASKPSGETDIVLGAGKLLFHSSSYSWLVVSGNKATYRGAGTLNLKPGYEFLLTVTDGGVKGVDKIRIKIWEKGTSKVIYDTQMGAPDTADPSIIAYGSVVVLK